VLKNKKFYHLTKRIKPTPASGALIWYFANLDILFYSNIYTRLARLMRIPLAARRLSQRVSENKKNKKELDK